METDLMYQMYEIEKNKQRHEKQKTVSKNNLKMAVNSTYIEIEYFRDTLFQFIV
jgi:hypothetical protein